MVIYFNLDTPIGTFTIFFINHLGTRRPSNSYTRIFISFIYLFIININGTVGSSTVIRYLK